MIRGLYTAASGMVSDLRMQEAVAENLANMTTPGYKGERVGLQEFSGVLARRVGQADGPLPLAMNQVIGRVGTGAYVDERNTVLAQGVQRETKLPLDVMLQGEGFFVVNTNDGVRYTRDGHFGRDASDRLVSSDGFPILDAAGNEIVLSSDNVRILPTGEILETVEQPITPGDPNSGTKVTEEVVGKLNAVLIDEQGLVRSGGSRFVLAPGFGTTPAKVGEQTVFVQGALEGTNVDTADVSTQLMSLQRAYSASQHVFSTLNESLQLAVRDIGRVG